MCFSHSLIYPFFAIVTTAKQKKMIKCLDSRELGEMVSPKLMDNRRIGMKILLMKKVWRRKHFWNTEYISAKKILNNYYSLGDLTT